MALPTVNINGNTYPAPSIDRLKRKQIKNLNPALERMRNEDLDAIWEIVGLMVPTLPEADLDELDLGDCKKILSDSGIAQFNDSAPADGAEQGDAEAPITLGESSASTDS